MTEDLRKAWGPSTKIGKDDELATTSTPSSAAAATIVTSITEPDGATRLLRLEKFGKELGADRRARAVRWLHLGYSRSHSHPVRRAAQGAIRGP